MANESTAENVEMVEKDERPIDNDAGYSREVLDWIGELKKRAKIVDNKAKEEQAK